MFIFSAALLDSFALDLGSHDGLAAALHERLGIGDHRENHARGSFQGELARGLDRNDRHIRHRLAEKMRENRALHEHLGDVDCVAQFTVLDGGPGGEPWHVQVTFEGVEVTDVRQVEDEADFARADFVVDAWIDR